MTGSVKRSLSTPNVQQAATVLADSGSLSYSADKRRNKLGYHRTSVACGHCRRRKIRCLLDKDDSHGRCSNCIRLKKECNFYPVENTDRRPRSMSKPDNSSSQEPASSASSPSPGYGLSRLQPAKGPRGYPASVPVTPTYFSGSFEDGLRHGNLANSGGQIAGSRSTDVSRKPSLAHLHAMPLALKVEQGYLSPHDGFPRRWELPSQADPSAPVTPVTPITAQPRATLEDPSTAFWRLNSSDLRPAASFIPSQPKVGSMASFSSIDSADVPDDGWTSQVPSRVGSVDHGIGSGYSFGHSSFETDYPPPPELCSASASTASLTASVSEASHYGGDSRPTPGQYYLGHQWGEQQPTAGSSYSVETPVKTESLEPNVSSYAGDTRYAQIHEENPFLFPSPLHSPAPVGMSHV
ncbi:hypothetical protein EDC01DRAFT_610129 [Geopyxis carbonaria]|nr:hypothetical protein EDC01DRAFT_610129 [Geopyxis carbonaria]